MSSKDMKLIMENWRKFSVITENNIASQTLHEKFQDLDEGQMANIATLGLVIGAGLAPGDAEAGDLVKYGQTQASEIQVDVAGNLAKAKSKSIKGKDQKAWQDADALADWVVAQPANVDQNTMERQFAEEMGWDYGRALSAYQILMPSIDHVKDVGIEKAKHQTSVLDTGKSKAPEGGLKSDLKPGYSEYSVSTMDPEKKAELEKAMKDPRYQQWKADQKR